MKQIKSQKKQRLLMMVFGAFAILFTGYPHVWSIYQSYIMEQTGWSQGQASLCFYLAISMFVLGNVIGGRIQDKSNPRLVVFIGGGIFSVGILLSAFLIISSPIPIYITYGVMQGFGQGMIYTTIISTAQKWFPCRTGFASGVVVTANGLCGFFLAPISRKLLEAGGARLAFLVIGAVIAVSWILCSIFFYIPNQGWRENEEIRIFKLYGNMADASNEKQYTSAEMIHTKKFFLLFATMLFGLISYFMLAPVSQTYQTEMGISAATAVGAIMLGSIMNAGTRLVLPSLADKVGRIACIKVVLAVSAMAMLVLSTASSYVIVIAIVIMYGCYGGIMGSFPSLTSSIFGLKHSGENYGFVMFGIMLATFGAPVITSLVTKKDCGMKTVFAIGMVFAIIAFICIILLDRELDRMNEKKLDVDEGKS